MNEKLNFYREYPASPERVWAAITKGDALAEWFMAGDFKAEAGADFSFAEPGLEVWGKVLEVEKNNKLSFLWISKRDDEDGAAGIASLITWTLSPGKSGGTAVSLEHRVLEEAKPIVIIEAAVNWSYAIHSSLALFLEGKYRQPTPIVYVVETPEESDNVLKRAGFRQPEVQLV